MKVNGSGPIIKLSEMPDSVFFKQGVALKELQGLLRSGDKKARILCEMAALTKRMVNEGVAFEDLLSEEGLLNVSKAMYSLEWSQLYYAEQERVRARRARGYWKRLLDALRGIV